MDKVAQDIGNLVLRTRRCIKTKEFLLSDDGKSFNDDVGGAVTRGARQNSSVAVLIEELSDSLNNSDCLAGTRSNLPGNEQR